MQEIEYPYCSQGILIRGPVLQTMGSRAPLVLGLEDYQEVQQFRQFQTQRFPLFY